MRTVDRPRRPALQAFLAGWLMLWGVLGGPLSARSADWIWSPEHESSAVPRTACHFRKEFSVASPVRAEMTIAADDRYELYLNGRRVGEGESADATDRHDVARWIRSGRNLIAVKVSNTEGGTAALAIALKITEHSGGTRTVATDGTWLTSLNPLPLWHTVVYSDARWDAAQSFGKVSETTPWDPPQPASREMAAAGSNTAAEPRTDSGEGASEEPPEYRVEEVLGNAQTGSLVALAFNEFGDAIAARENGELVRIKDTDDDGILDDVRVCCGELRSARGILCLNGAVYATGEGPQGLGLYRLADANRDGNLEEVKLLLALEGRADESTPRGITLGTDGYLYLVIGNELRPVPPFAASSPYENTRDVDLVRPRLEIATDAQHQSAASSAAIVRLSIDGDRLEIFAGGLSAACDLAFDRHGELFTCDRHSPADLGTPWYRPASLYHAVPGAEFGWRSGWSNLPEYALDRVRPVLEFGSGTPSGMVFYNHYAFPEEYHHALFVGDWLEGTITAVKLKQSGSGYAASAELFMEEKDLRVTDLDVGPDGWLYFAAGGRGETGGLFRIRWTGEASPALAQVGEGLNAVIRQPQLDAAWARQQVAATKTELGESWDRMIPGVALSSANPWFYRVRALDLMELLGPTPTAEMLVKLSQATNEHVRARAASAMGLHAGEPTETALRALLADSDRRVRRSACDALLRAGQTADPQLLSELLKSDDAGEAAAARRLLGRMPVEQWQRFVDDKHPRLTIQACLALLETAPDGDRAKQVLARLRGLIAGFVTDRDFVDVLRVMQLAFLSGELTAGDAPELRTLLAEEFPSSDHTINRELVRLLTYLQADQILDRYLEQLQSPAVPEIEKLHLALHLTRMDLSAAADARLRVVDFLAQPHDRHHGSRLDDYAAQAVEEVVQKMSPDDVRGALASGAGCPAAAFALLYRLPVELDPATLETLKRLDAQLRSADSPSAARLKVGIVAVLARSADAESMRHLRQVWEHDPELRPAVAMGLAQSIDPQNGELLIASLPILEGDAAREVLEKLASFPNKPDRPEPFRQVLLLAQQLGDDGAALGLELLQAWTGKRLAEEATWPLRLQAWQEWYAVTYPDELPAEPPVASETARWKYQDLVAAISGDQAASASPADGAAVFARGGCVQCHRFGDQGGEIGPDLTAVGQRAMKKEILQSLVHPSHRIAADQRTQAVFAVDGRIHLGRAQRSADGLGVAVTSGDGGQAIVPDERIEQTRTVRVSPMPDGLLEPLSLQEILDLVAYLTAVPQTQLAERSDETVER